MELVGSPAPAASVKTIDNKEIRIGAGSDRIQLLTFYASWCGYCRRAMPIVEQLHKDYQSKGVDVIAINGDARSGRRAKTEEQTLATYKEWNLSMPMTMDPEQTIGQQFKARSYPTFVLVGRSGTVEAAHVGAAPTFDSTVRTELNLLLQGKTREAFPQQPVPPAATQPQERNPAMRLSGKPAPSAPAKTPDGSDIRIGSGSGKVQLLAFYASWCGYCKRAMPAVEQLHKEFKDKGVEVIAVNQDTRSGRGAKTEEQSLATYKEWNLSMPVTMDPDHKIGEQFMVRGYPTFFIVGSNGNVEAVYIGGREVAGNIARSQLDSLLRNKPLTGESGAGGNGAPLHRLGWAATMGHIGVEGRVRGRGDSCQTGSSRGRSRWWRADRSASGAPPPSGSRPVAPGSSSPRGASCRPASWTLPPSSDRSSRS